MKTDSLDAVTQALAGRDKPMKQHKVAGIHVRKGHAGGYIARHDLEDSDGNSYHGKSPEFPLASMAAVHKHMDEHMGEEAKEAVTGEEE